MPTIGGRAINPLEINKARTVTLSRSQDEPAGASTGDDATAATHGQMIASLGGLGLWITLHASEVIHGHLVAAITVTWSRHATDSCGPGHGHFVAQTDSITFSSSSGS